MKINVRKILSLILSISILFTTYFTATPVQAVARTGNYPPTKPSNNITIEQNNIPATDPQSEDLERILVENHNQRVKNFYDNLYGESSNIVFSNDNTVDRN